VNGFGFSGLAFFAADRRNVLGYGFDVIDAQQRDLLNLSDVKRTIEQASYLCESEVLS